MGQNETKYSPNVLANGFWFGISHLQSVTSLFRLLQNLEIRLRLDDVRTAPGQLFLGSGLCQSEMVISCQVVGLKYLQKIYFKAEAILVTGMAGEAISFIIRIKILYRKG